MFCKSREVNVYERLKNVLDVPKCPSNVLDVPKCPSNFSNKKYPSPDFFFWLKTQNTLFSLHNVFFSLNLFNTFYTSFLYLYLFKTPENQTFLTFSGGVEIENWPETGESSHIGLLIACRYSFYVSLFPSKVKIMIYLFLTNFTKW